MTSLTDQLENESDRRTILDLIAQDHDHVHQDDVHITIYRLDCPVDRQHYVDLDSGRCVTCGATATETKLT